jgi:hypothetical protein
MLDLSLSLPITKLPKSEVASPHTYKEVQEGVTPITSKVLNSNQENPEVLS